MDSYPRLPGPAGESTPQPGADSQAAETPEPETPEPSPSSQQPPDASAEAPSGGRRRKRKPVDRQTLRQLMIRLVGLIGLGLISPPTGNSMLRFIVVLLKDMDSEQATRGSAQGVDVEQLREQVRAQPGLLDALEPLLSEELLAQLLADELEE